jgi:hypothetical protein
MPRAVILAAALLAAPVTAQSPIRIGVDCVSGYPMRIAFATAVPIPADTPFVLDLRDLVAYCQSQPATKT